MRQAARTSGTGNELIFWRVKPLERRTALRGSPWPERRIGYREESSNSIVFFITEIPETTPIR